MSLEFSQLVVGVRACINNTQLPTLLFQLCVFCNFVLELFEAQWGVRVYIQTMYGSDSLRAKFNISAKANSFSFGLIREDKYIAYDQLSSGEKCLYTLALMICIADNSKCPLKLLLCDDMFDHLDSKAVEGTVMPRWARSRTDMVWT